MPTCLGKDGGDLAQLWRTTGQTVGVVPAVQERAGVRLIESSVDRTDR
jgi:hypothetical protein